VDHSGGSVSLSADGDTVAIGAPYNGGNGGWSGQVRVYRLDDNQAWKMIGDDIDGEAEADRSGFSVSLSADGETVAIGAIFNDGNGNGYYSGHVRVYRLDDNQAWKMIGDDIDGEIADGFGFSVSLSADGDTVAIGAPSDDGNGNGNDSGHVRVYRLDDNQAWKKIGDVIDWKGTDDYSGISISLSADGDTVAIGVQSFVRVYRLGSLPSQSPSRFLSQSPSISPSQSPSSFPSQSPSSGNDILHASIAIASVGLAALFCIATIRKKKSKEAPQNGVCGERSSDSDSDVDSVLYWVDSAFDLKQQEDEDISDSDSESDSYYMDRLNQIAIM